MYKRIEKLEDYTSLLTTKNLLETTKIFAISSSLYSTSSKMNRNRSTRREIYKISILLPI